MKRNRRVGSIKSELVIKSRESMLTAVQVFNNPNIQFKAESFIVLSIISWTYLLHAYYRDKKIEYRYYQMVNNRRKFDKTKCGADKYWELDSPEGPSRTTTLIGWVCKRCEALS